MERVWNYKIMQIITFQGISYSKIYSECKYEANCPLPKKYLLSYFKFRPLKWNIKEKHSFMLCSVKIYFSVSDHFSSLKWLRKFLPESEFWYWIFFIYLYCMRFQLQRGHLKQATTQKINNVLLMQIHHNKNSATILLMQFVFQIPKSAISNRRARMEIP